MALNVDTGTFTDLTSTGNKTISLAANFDPKAIIMWGTKNTADGSIAHYDFGIGFGTYRSSTVAQRCVGIRGLDAAVSADTSFLIQSDSLIELLTDAAASTTVDLEIDLVSMQTGATSEVVLNVVNAAPAAWRMHYMILGGSDITDALVGTGTLPVSSPEDITVASGFGKPELVFMIGAQFTGGGFTVAADDPGISFGFAKQGEAGRCFSFTQQDGNTASLTSQTIENNKILHTHADPGSGGASTELINASLDTTVSNWPTDGFRVIHNDVAFAGEIYGWLAIRTSAQITTGEDGALTSIAQQDDDVGYPPKGALVLSMNSTVANSKRGADAVQASWMVGAYDGTNEVSAGISEDDAAGTMDSNMQSSTAKLIQTRNQAGTIDGEADGVFTGNVFRRDWTDAAPSAYLHEWLVLGDAPAAASGSLIWQSRPLRHLTF